MDAVAANRDQVAVEIIREVWSNLGAFSAVMAMLPNPVKNHLGQYLQWGAGFRADNFGVE